MKLKDYIKFISDLKATFLSILHKFSSQLSYLVNCEQDCLM